jgi:hypothetical protein
MSDGTLSLSDEAPLNFSNEAPQIEELLTKAEVEKFKATYDRFTAVRTDAGVAVFRAPTRGEYARFQHYLFDEKTRAKATEGLVATCVILPDAKIFQTWLDKFPGISVTCSDAVSKLAGVDTDAQTKKY